MSWISGTTTTFPGIETIPGVSGGDAVIARTRIPVWLLVEMRKAGISDADLLGGYPTLNDNDRANAWAYCAAHQDDIDT